MQGSGLHAHMHGALTTAPHSAHATCHLGFHINSPCDPGVSDSESVTCYTGKKRISQQAAVMVN